MILVKFRLIVVCNYTHRMIVVYSSVVSVSTAKVGGLGFDSQWLYPCIFSSVCFYPDLPPVASLQFLLPVVVNQYSYKNNYVWFFGSLIPLVGVKRFLWFLIGSSVSSL